MSQDEKLDICITRIKTLTFVTLVRFSRVILNTKFSKYLKIGSRENLVCSTLLVHYSILVLLYSCNILLLYFFTSDMGCFQLHQSLPFALYSCNPIVMYPSTPVLLYYYNNELLYCTPVYSCQLHQSLPSPLYSELTSLRILFQALKTSVSGQL